MRAFLQRKSAVGLLGVAGIAALGMFLTGAADTGRRPEIRLIGPVGGTQGETLRVVVTALPSEASSGDVLVHIEAYDALETGLGPVAVFDARIEAGRGEYFDYGFRARGEATARQEVLLRLEILRTGPRAEPVPSSWQLINPEGKTTRIWGD